MNRKLVILFAFGLTILNACGPSEGEIQATVDAAQTAAVETVHADYTRIAELTPSATETLTPSDTPTPTPTEASTSTATPEASDLSTGSCDVMTFVADVTVTDGEELAANSPFTKTWRVRNDGTCTWSTDYNVVFGGGDQMDGPSSQPLAAQVAPGETTDISIELTAPSTEGSYTGTWVLSNPAGDVFGSFFLEIKVVLQSGAAPNPATRLALVAGPVIVP